MYDTEYYKLTVIGGNGSGEYEAGEKIIVWPDTPPENYRFVGWAGDTSILSAPYLDTLIVTMPPYDTEIIAQYKYRWIK